MAEPVEKEPIDKIIWQINNLKSHDKHVEIAKLQRQQAVEKLAKTIQDCKGQTMVLSGVAVARFISTGPVNRYGVTHRTVVTLDTNVENNFGPGEFSIGQVEGFNVLVCDPEDPNESFGHLVPIENLNFHHTRENSIQQEKSFSRAE